MESIVQLVRNCATRGISAQQFLNFYHELINEKYMNGINSGDEEQEIDSKKQVFETISKDLIQAFESGIDDILLAEYMFHLAFVNYDTYLTLALLPQIYTIPSERLLTHFHSLAAAFIGNLDDLLIKEQITQDLSTFILASCLQVDLSGFSNQLFMSIVKYLLALLSLVNDNVDVKLDKEVVKTSVSSMVTRASNLNRIMGKKFGRELESKLNIPIGSKFTAFNSPKIFSPNSGMNRFVSTLGVNRANEISNSSSAFPSTKVQDIKLVRFYKNLWLNNKIHNFNATDPRFLEKFGLINSGLLSLNSDEQHPHEKVTDLIDTAFTSFAQLLNNKIYHQSHTNFDLLERKYIHFISKLLPLILKDVVPQNPTIIVNALQNIDEKVKKAIKSYYSNKDDSPERNEDLFDDYSDNNFDIRHEFLRNLIMLNLKPPSVLNEFLREDQMIDVKTLKTNDTLEILNSQGVLQEVSDVQDTIRSLLLELDIENQYISNGSNYRFLPDHPLLKLLASFDSVPPTKQTEVASAFAELLKKACESSDSKTAGKIFWILLSNIGHSTTSIFCSISPTPFINSAIQYIDSVPTLATNNKADEAAYDSMHSFVPFGLALCFVINVKTTYDIDIETFIQDYDQSYVIKFLSSIEDIPENYTLEAGSTEDSDEYLQNWLKDLFVNGSISDSQMKDANIKDMINLVPFVFKQSLMGVQAGVVSNTLSFSSGFEYFLQPFLLPGLIKVMFWLEYYLLSLRNNTPSPQILSSCWELINILVSPPSLDDDAKGLHFMILKLNCIGLLKVLHLFKTDENNSGQYGVYAAHESMDPKLETLVSKLEYVASISQIYDIDPKFYQTTKEGYSHTTLYSGKIPIINEFSIDKIMTNQLNSFWNLHSSVYYNYDYLLELINLITPEKFLIDSVRTLNYKVSVFGIPGTQGKINNSAIEQVANFFSYFMLLHDVQTEEQKIALQKYIESGEISSVVTELEPELEPKLDDDFDMLFGEPFNNSLDESSMVFPQSEPAKNTSSSVFHVFKGTFGVVVADMNVRFERSREEGFFSDEDYQNATIFTRKYIDNLKNLII